MTPCIINDKKWMSKYINLVGHNLEVRNNKYMKNTSLYYYYYPKQPTAET